MRRLQLSSVLLLALGLGKSTLALDLLAAGLGSDASTSSTAQLISAGQTAAWTPLSYLVSDLPPRLPGPTADTKPQIAAAWNTSYEFNDNLTRDSGPRVEGSVVTSYLELQGLLPLTKKTRFRLDAALGFNSYFDQPELIANGNTLNFLVAPGSSVSFETELGPVRLRLYDRLSLQNSPSTAFSIQPNEILSYLDNQAGLDLQWQMNPAWRLDLRYAHRDLRSMDDTVSDGPDGLFDRREDIIRATLGWSPTGVGVLGVEGALGWHRYDSAWSNEAFTRSLGLFIDTPLSKKLQLRAQAGVQQLEFESPPPFKRSAPKSSVNAAKKEADLRIDQAAKLLGISPGELEETLRSGRSTETRKLEGARSAAAADYARLQKRRFEILQFLRIAIPLDVPRLLAELRRLDAMIAQLVARFSATANGSEALLAAESAWERWVQLQATNLAEDAEYLTSNRDSSELTDYYARLTLSHQISATVSQSLTVGHESALNTTSNFLSSDYASYSLDFCPWPDAQLSLSAFYEWAQESGGISQQEIFEEELFNAIAFRQDYDQYGAALSFSQRLHQRLSLTLAAQYSRLDSSGDFYSFTENAAQASLSYLLTPKTRVTLGYRFTTVNTDAASQDFNQQRLLLSIRQQF